MITGKGMYIWIVQRCGEPKAIAQAAKAGGLSHMLVKIADGPFVYYGANDWNDHSRDWSMELVHALQAVGITVVGWQYVYGIQPEKEAEIAAQRIREGGIQLFDIDAEKEYKADGMKPKATAYCSRLKHLVPDVKLGLGTYRYPTYHATLPWAEFGQFMDFYMPQVYWAGAHNPVEQLGRCLREYAGLPYPNIPIYPTGAAYREFGWQPLSGEDTAFLTAARDLYHLGAANLWEWYDVKIVYPEFWDEISSFDYGSQPSVPQPPPSSVLPEYVLVNAPDGLNMRLTSSKTGQIVALLPNGRKLHVVGVQKDEDGKNRYQVYGYVASWLTKPL